MHSRPPAAEDVRAYCAERNNKIDPEYFMDYYASKGWMVGGEPMQDWKAAVRAWEKNQGKFATKGGGGAATEKDYDEPFDD
jgi:hypothetical protein